MSWLSAFMSVSSTAVMSCPAAVLHRRGHVGITGALLEAGADVSKVATDGTSALMEACHAHVSGAAVQPRLARFGTEPMQLLCTLCLAPIPHVPDAPVPGACN
jgi:hypothetical protein